MYVGIFSDDGCPANNIRQGCYAAQAIIVFDYLWGFLELCAWACGVYNYYCRDRIYEKDDQTSGREKWIRGTQVRGTHPTRQKCCCCSLRHSLT